MDLKMPTDKITPPPTDQIFGGAVKPPEGPIPAILPPNEYMISNEQKARLDAALDPSHNVKPDGKLGEQIQQLARHAGRRLTDTMERYNAGKDRLGLIPPSLNRYLAQVLMYGALKYAAHNWRKGGSWVENSESLQRHLDLWKEGEDCDAESGLPHLAHMAFNVMALIEFYDKGLGSDDRFRYPDQPPDQRRPGRTLQFREPPRRS